MKFLNFNISKFLGTILIWFFSITILTIILIQISLWFGIKWLNSENGSAWAQSNINLALEDSDYKINLKDFKYSPISSLTVSKLQISDNVGDLININNAKISVSFASLALRQLSFSLQAQKATLLRLPESKNNPEEEIAIKPFLFPDIYFNKIKISDIDIRNLEISETILGKKINLSPRISGSLSLSKELASLKLNLHPDSQEITAVQNLPKKITFQGQYNAQTSILTVNKFEAESPLYHGLAEGKANLTSEGDVEFSGYLKTNNLKDLSPQLDGKINSTFLLSGTIQNLIFKSDGNIDLKILKDKQLTPIKFNIESNIVNEDTQILTANVSLESDYQNLPVTISAQVSNNNDDILFNDIKASAPDIAIVGDLIFNTQKTLVSGDLNANFTSLNNYKNFIGKNINATGDINILLSHPNDTQKIISDSNVTNASYNDIKANNIKISTTTNDINKYQESELKLEVKNLSSDQLILKNGNASILKTKTGYSLKTNGDGKYIKPFSFNGTSNLLNLTNTDLAPKAENINATINLGNSPIIIAGKIDSQNIDLKIDTKSLSLSNLPISLPSPLNNIILSGTTSVKGLMSGPVIKSDINLNPISISKQTPSVNINLNSEYNSGQAVINFKGRGTGIQQLQGSVKTPIKLSLNPYSVELPSNQSLDGLVNLSLQMKEFSNLLLPIQYDLSGKLTSQINIKGNIQKPALTGNAIVNDGNFTDDVIGIKLKNIDMATYFDNDQITLKNFTAKDDKNGKLTANGVVTLDNYALNKADLNLSLKDFHLLQSDIADGFFNAEINLKGSSDKYSIGGTIKSDYIDINIPETSNQSIPELNIVKKDEQQSKQSIINKIVLNLQYMADNRIFVRGWGLDAEFGGKILIKGNLDNPKFDGRLQSIRGRYEEFGKRFELTKANLNFFGTIPPSPNLDITAETQADDILAKINLTGSITDPKINFSSTPSLPDDEVLSRILFGQNLSTISPFQAVQLAQTLRRFSGKGGSRFDPLAKIREATGLDDLRIDTDEDGQANVGVGKYLTDKVYLEFEKGTNEDSGAANLQIEVTPNITVESELGQDTQGGAGVFWEWDY